MNEDLKKIKKLYGEKMMHLCRELFPTILDEEGLLSKLIIDHFYPSRELYNDIIKNKLQEDFKNYIYSLISEQEKVKVVTNKTPQELLSEAGYDLYICETEKDIQKFKKYYKPGEELCSFNGRRLDKCYVFFAVKKNVDKIKREDFEKPLRQDEYGVSVISIQFTKGDVNTLSIKNRYNHTIFNPDATFYNNLENIIPGLTESFERTYNLKKNNDIIINFEIPEYVQANDGKFYRYNYEINNVYYCPNNIIIDNFEVKKFDLEKFIILDYFILNLSKENKRIALYDNSIMDSFTSGIKNIKNISIIRSNKTGNKQIEINTKAENNIIITIDSQNKIIGYQNNELNETEDKFLCFNELLNDLSLPNLKQTGDYFLPNNKGLIVLNLPSLTKSGSFFLSSNLKIEKINIESLTEADPYFLNSNVSITTLDAPSLIRVNNHFLSNNKILKEINAPKLDYESKKKLASRFKINGNYENLKDSHTKVVSKNNRIISNLMKLSIQSKVNETHSIKQKLLKRRNNKI